MFSKIRGLWRRAKNTSEPIIFARKGEIITCENGHEICRFKNDVRSGAFFDGGSDLTDWKQPQPQRGSQKVVCAECGGLWWHGIGGGMHFFIEGKWRSKSPKEASHA